MSAPPESVDPRGEYARRLDRERGRAVSLARRSRLISNTRLAVFVAGVVVAWLVFAPPYRLGLAALAPFVAGFVALIAVHDRTLRRLERARRAAELYERGIARIEDRWAGQGDPGERHLDPHHPYAADLDLFGHASLFELLCTARTRAGEDTLARWLKEPATPDAVRARQAAVAELRPRVDLREDLALLGEDLRVALDPDALARWGEAPAQPAAPATRIAALALSLLAVAAAAVWILTPLGPLPLLAVVALEGALALRLRPRVLAVIAGAEHPARELAVLAEVLGRIERERFESAHLTALRAELDTHGVPPSRRIAMLRRRAELLDSRRNQLFAPVAALLLWGTQLALAIEAWRAESGPSLGRWIAVAGEIEALCALSGYAFEHPADPFPELVEDRAVFDGEGLGHPLLPESRCIRNEVVLDAACPLWIVSGSNMSGKSTLLRTVGTNAVLAQAGAPVRARRLRLSPLRLGASIRVQDSLQEGASRFYAEITRLRQLADLAGGSPPLLFLLDELLQGTNSHDRRIGAEAVVRGLVDRGALGLMTTHDLALARIADAVGGRARNVHFEDQLEDGRIRFDYRVRPGVVRKSNAIALMRAVGLEV